jgi:hypothetical protein
MKIVGKRLARWICNEACSAISAPSRSICYDDSGGSCASRIETLDTVRFARGLSSGNGTDEVIAEYITSQNERQDGDVRVDG